ncbi:MAG: hypothetical protein ACXQT5_03965 [Candidatus Syntropharchaeia archaeon]
MPIRKGKKVKELSEKEKEIIREAKARYRLGAKDNRTGLRHPHPSQPHSQISG